MWSFRITQWRLFLFPDGATEPWSILGWKRKNTSYKKTLTAHIKYHNTKLQH